MNQAGTVGETGSGLALLLGPGPAGLLQEQIMKRAIRTCILCCHMHFDAGEPAYSDVTPAVEWSSGCDRGHWVMSGCNVTEEEYRENLMMAATCKDFTPPPSADAI